MHQGGGKRGRRQARPLQAVQAVLGHHLQPDPVHVGVWRRLRYYVYEHGTSKISALAAASAAPMGSGKRGPYGQRQARPLLAGETTW